MTSTILTPKSNFGSVFKQSVKRCVPHLISIFVVNILASVVAVSLTFSRYSDYLAEFIKKRSTETAELTAETLYLLGLVCMLCGFFSLFASVRMFKEIYSKRACDFYFSMPIKRETYFTANFLFGALVNIVAVIIPVIIYVSVFKSVNGSFFLFDDEYIAKVVCAVVLALLAMYSAFMMCAVISGKKIHYVLLSLICIFCPSVASSGVVIRLNDIWGYYASAGLPNSISPPMNVFNSVFSSGTDLLKYLVIISIVEIIGMFTVGYLVFKARKAEVAEVSLTGNIAPYFLLALFVLSGFMYANTLTNEISTALIGIVFAVISGLLFSAIFYKKAFTKKTAVTTGVVCLVCVIFVCLVYLPGYDKYVKYVPNADQVEKVEILNPPMDNYYGSTLLNELVNFGDSDDGTKPIYTITNEKSIEDAINIHKKAVEDDTISKCKKMVMSPFDTYFADYSSFETYDFNIVYTLKDGSKVERTYSVLTECLNDEFLKLMRNKDVLVQNCPFYKDDSLLFATLEYYDFTDYDETEYYDDTEYYGETEIYVYDKILNADQCNGFLDSYMDDLVKVDDDKLLYNLYYNSFNGLYFPAPEGEYSQGVANINFYYIDENATAQDVEKIKNMTPDEIIQKYYNYSFESENEPISYVNSYSFDVFDYETQALKYLEILK